MCQPEEYISLDLFQSWMIKYNIFEVTNYSDTVKELDQGNGVCERVENNKRKE